MTAATPLTADLEAGLRRLRLSAIRKLAPELLVTATIQRWKPEQPLAAFVEAEIASRDASNARGRPPPSVRPARRVGLGPDSFGVPAAPAAVRAHPGGMKREFSAAKAASVLARIRPRDEVGRSAGLWPPSTWPTSGGLDRQAQLETEIINWIYWYNERRLHREIGDIPPAEYEQFWYNINQPVPTGN